MIVTLLRFPMTSLLLNEQLDELARLLDIHEEDMGIESYMEACNMVHTMLSGD